jgi:hypothetical protein
MPPEETDKKPETTTTPDETDSTDSTESAAKPAVTASAAKKSIKTPLLIGLAAVLLLGGGAYAYTQMTGDDDQAATQTQLSESDDSTSAETDFEIPDGYKLFSDALIGVSFTYPEGWGETTLSGGEEERMDHLTAGSQKIISFSNNSKVVAGVASKDWTHDPDMGHGGVGEPGVKTMADAKKVKDDILASNVLVDTDTQFAYVTYCADNCSDEPKLQIHNSVAITGNPTYEIIQFYLDGDNLNTDYYTEDDLVDYEKLDADDLSLLFPETDARFIELQKVANSVTNL